MASSRSNRRATRAVRVLIVTALGALLTGGLAFAAVVGGSGAPAGHAGHDHSHHRHVHAAATTLSVSGTARNACSPSALTAPAGQLTIRFTNPLDDWQSFGIVGVGTGAPERVRDGATSTLTATLGAGTYTFWCGDDADDDDVMRGTLTVGGGGGGGGTTTTTPGGSPPAALSVTTYDYSFQPSALQASAGTVTLSVTNAGSDLHTWTAPGLATVTVSPGETRTISFFAAAGTYQFFCGVGSHADKGMRGTLTVTGTATNPPPPPPPPPAPQPPPGSPAGPLSVTAEEFAFRPSSLSAQAGTVSLTVTNRGQLPHTFTIDGLVDAELAPGQTRTVAFNAAPGSYRFYCAVSGHAGAGMAGTLVVGAAGSAPPPPPASQPPPPSGGAPATQQPAPTTTAATPAAPARGAPARLPRGCRPRATTTLSGTVVAASASALTLRVARASASGRRYLGKRVSVVLHTRTAFTRVGRAELSAPKPGDRVTVAAGRCKARPGKLLAVRVAVSPAAASPAGGATLELWADAKGFPRFDRTALEAPAGLVTLRLTNPSPLPHNVAIDGHGAGKQVSDGGVSVVSAKLAAGRYTFLCLLPGHAQAGMKGTLTVR